VTKVLALTRYDALGASSRLRSFQYREPLRQRGIDFDIIPLFGDDYVRSLYAGEGRIGLVLLAFAKRLRTLASSRKYDAVWVEKEILPWLPAMIELSLVPAGMPLISDYDDAVFHRYDQHRCRDRADGDRPRTVSAAFAVKVGSCDNWVDRFA
jgi:hypothetical protein